MKLTMMFPKKSFQNPYKTDFLVKKFSPAALTQGLGTLVCKFSQIPKLYHPQILNKVIFPQNLFVVFFSGIRKKNKTVFSKSSVCVCVYPINFSWEKKTPPLDVGRERVVFFGGFVTQSAHFFNMY